MTQELEYPHWGTMAYFKVEGGTEEERDRNMVAFWEKVYNLVDQDPNISQASWEWNDDHDYCETCINIENLNNETRKQAAQDKVEEALKVLAENFQTAAYDSTDYQQYQAHSAAVVNLRTYFNGKTGRAV